MAMDSKKFYDIANNALSNYSFGDDVTVEAVNGWEYNSDYTDVMCTVFLKFDDDEPDADTHKAAFIVTIENEVVVDASCLYKGEIIGFMAVEKLAA